MESFPRGERKADDGWDVVSSEPWFVCIGSDVSDRSGMFWHSSHPGGEIFNGSFGRVV
jgi:hypothetical protein